MTDRRTDIIAISILRVSTLTRDKNVGPTHFHCSRAHLHEDDSEVDKLRSSVGYSSRRERQQTKCRALTETPSRLASTLSNNDIASA